MYCATEEVDVALEGAAAGNNSANQVSKKSVCDFNSIDPAAQGTEDIEASLPARGGCDGVGVGVRVCGVGEECHGRSSGLK